MNQQLECTPCKACNRGWYVSAPCSNKLGADSVCKPCTVNVCEDGYKPFSTCTGATAVDNTFCVPCTEDYENDYRQVFAPGHTCSACVCKCVCVCVFLTRDGIFAQGPGCKKTLCNVYVGSPLCSPIGGEYVKRCTGSPLNDTSACVKCRLFAKNMNLLQIAAANRQNKHTHKHAGTIHRTARGSVA